MASRKPLPVFAASSSKVKFVVFQVDEEAAMRARYVNRFPIARMLRAPVWEIRPDELKFTDNTLGFGTKLHWLRHPDSE
jgi:uncharacterized protein YhbP (UPF0306 family)